MKRFLSTKFFSNTRNDRNYTEVNKSVKQIEREVESLNKDIEDFEKQIRIQTKICEDFERQLSEELKEKEAIDRLMIEMRREEKQLIEGIDRKTKHSESLNQTDSDLHKMIVSLNKEFNQKSEEYENQIKEFTEIRNHYKNQLEIRRGVYQTLNQTIKCCSPDLGPVYSHLELKKSEFNELQSELESLENQIKEKRSENKIPNEEVEQYADPIPVIIEMAKIKLNSNKLEEIIKIEINRRQNLDINANQINNELSVETENLSLGNSSQLIETNTQMDFTPNVDTNIVPKVEINDTSVGFHMFEAQSPEKDFLSFGGQTNTENVDISEGHKQSSQFSPFVSTSLNTLVPNQSIFGFFGDRTPTAETNNNFGFENLFANQSNAGLLSPNRSEDSFHFFK